MAAGDYEGDGRIISLTPNVTAGVGLTAGSIVCMTDDYTGSTVAGDFDDTAVIGICLISSHDALYLGTVVTDGIFELESAAGTTAGKTILAISNTTVDDGTTAGKVIGRALETVGAAATGDMLIRV